MKSKRKSPILLDFLTDAETREVVHADDMQLQIQTFALDVRLHELPVEEVGVCLRAGENMGDAYLKINPLHKVPFLLDGDYGLPESCAILKYLKERFKDRIEDHWYPSDSKEAFAVDALMQWHHMTLRNGSTTLLVEYVFVASRTGTVRQEIVQQSIGALKNALNILENQFLSQTTYCCIPSTHTSIGMLPSLADLIIASELEGLSILKVLPKVDACIRDIHEFADYPHILKFLSEIRKFCGSHYDDLLVDQNEYIEAMKATPKL